jgi:hypothetical protein
MGVRQAPRDAGGRGLCGDRVRVVYSQAKDASRHKS